MTFEDQKIRISFDDSSGFTTSIRDPGDVYAMNWVLENSDWGNVDHFISREVIQMDDGIQVLAHRAKDNLLLTVEKRVRGGIYEETYTVTNNGSSEYFLTRDNFGIHFPYNCIFTGKENMHSRSCVTHVWCGGNISWMYSKKPDGSKPYFVGNVTRGSFSDYSISYDVSRVRLGAAYRGDIVMHPDTTVVLPGGSAVFSFAFYFSNTGPDSGGLCQYHRMHLCADKYSAFVGEPIHCAFRSLTKLENVRIACGDEQIPYERQGDALRFTLSFHTPGERKISVKADGCQTYMRVNILEPIEVILLRRAEFIAKKQQYHREGSCLDGAYLIYDRATDSQYYCEQFGDNNASRERLSMGVTVAQALQRKYDPFLMESLRKHRRFVEREIFDAATATVYDSVNRNMARRRAYNYPWMAVYYLEWYKLTGELVCLKYAARIMIAYYEDVNGMRQESPCMPMAELCQLLDQEGLYTLKEQLSAYTLRHADNILDQGAACVSDEVVCTQAMFVMKISLLCQAYKISKDEKYLKNMQFYLDRAAAFCAGQPDFHLQGNAVRYWDLYWFGKSRTYGDSMPQWLSALSAEAYDALSKVGFGERYRELSRQVLFNNLCVYAPDGFGSCGYLVPYKVVQYTSDREYQNAMMPCQTTYGCRYDDFANDQDWALYFAVKYAI